VALTALPLAAQSYRKRVLAELLEQGQRMNHSS
jgi:hypothetical protein